MLGGGWECVCGGGGGGVELGVQSGVYGGRGLGADCFCFVCVHYFVC